ncbi:MAG: LytR cell envelope-related transcriptional attenuator [Solirubrobacterales bacterium]|jgi:hypothetical protein|nr:LytR cell envelope-related transcriptional attenuator [Solirubrobacterales bacterium]
MTLIKTIGAFAGLASFLGLVLVAFLQFMQSRHVRDLEDKATFVPEGLDLPTSPVPAKKGKAATVATPGAAVAVGNAPDTEEAEQPVEAQVAQTKEAARQVEIARAAAERRERFERRRRPGQTAPTAVGSGAVSPGRRRPEPRAMIIIGLGVAVLAAGVIFAATNLLGGSDKSSTPGAGGAAAASPVTNVAVLNGTPVPALAAKVGQGEVRPAGFKLGFVGNTDIPFTVTTVMYDPSDPANQKTAQQVAGKLRITKIEPMTADVKKAIKGEPVAVVVGEDRAGA